jgi:hypothetical protein
MYISLLLWNFSNAQNILQRVHDWMYNNSRSPKSSKNKFERHWNMREVLNYQQNEDIKQRAAQISRALPGTKKYLASYQQALTQVMDELSDRERLELKQTAEEWSKGEVPKEVQQL